MPLRKILLVRASIPQPELTNCRRKSNTVDFRSRLSPMTESQKDKAKAARFCSIYFFSSAKRVNALRRCNFPNSAPCSFFLVAERAQEYSFQTSKENRFQCRAILKTTGTHSTENAVRGRANSLIFPNVFLEVISCIYGSQSFRWCLRNAFSILRPTQMGSTLTELASDTRVWADSKARG